LLKYKEKNIHGPIVGGWVTISLSNFATRFFFAIRKQKVLNTTGLAGVYHNYSPQNISYLEAQKLYSLVSKENYAETGLFWMDLQMTSLVTISGFFSHN
jgi:hypothetical protein